MVRALLVCTAAALLAGCSALPRFGGLPPEQVTLPAPPAQPLPPAAPAEPPRPAASPPPDAVPRVDRIPQGAPNVPYEIKGEGYDPESSDVPMVETGMASWYGRPFHGRRTATGEVYDMHAMTAAHKTMPLPSYARVRNPANGREIIVRVNDRGPFKPGRVIDLSYAAAKRLRIAGSGVARVQVQRLTHAEIRSGAWRAPGTATAQAR